jgi:predicted AAA+ superfamily ATPase
MNLIPRTQDFEAVSKLPATFPVTAGPESITTLWLRGGLPRSFLASTEEESLVWRRQYISTFLERDIPQLGITVPARTMRRFWTMLSHYQGQILNYSELSRSFGVSDMTVRR